MVPTPRGQVELLTWGQIGQPGLLLVHGNRAHADWWSFIAPFFADEFRVAALSLAGMGSSDWREHYEFEGFADDFEAVSDAASLTASSRKPVFIGHSFGGRLIFEFAARRSKRLGAAICIDIGFGTGGANVLAEREQMMKQRAMSRSERRVYPGLAEALASFRVSPPQPVENLFIVDYIARYALQATPDANGSGEGFVWRFDPENFERLDRQRLASFLDTKPTIDVPIAHIFGELSSVRPATTDRGPFPDHAVMFGIPAAYHHVAIDQPLALVAGLRAVLAGWSTRGI
jgi:pimeloyl-ACP methyl ester carboxylesterase